MTATASGFKQFVRDKVTLEAARVAGYRHHAGSRRGDGDRRGDGRSAALETQSRRRSGVVTTQQVAEMPLNARNPFMLGAMMSGVTFNGAAIWQRPFDNGAIAQWSMNGGRDSSTEFLLDGASNNGQMGSNNIAYVPIVDAVQEFNIMHEHVQRRVRPHRRRHHERRAEERHHQLPRRGWEFMRRTSLDANTFQNNAIGIVAINGGAIRPTHYLDQYGFQLEGPIYIPEDPAEGSPVKLFYLGSFENYREGTPNPLIALVSGTRRCARATSRN